MPSDAVPDGEDGVPPRLTDPEFLAGLRSRIPFAGTLRVQFVSVSSTSVTARLDWSADFCTDTGTLHGGALMALADVCGGVCAGLNLPAGSTGTATIESKTNFLRPVRSGSVQAISEPLHVGRTTIVIQTDVLDDNQRRVARVTQTQVVFHHDKLRTPSG